jgi:phosphate transport system substrate-binding protein
MKAIQLVISFIFLCWMGACKNKPTSNTTPVADTIRMSVDESFKPAIAEQVKVFQSEYPFIVMQVSYKSEADCFRDLQTDTTRLVIVARGLQSDEQAWFQNNKGNSPIFDIMAYDAVAVITNKAAADSVFSFKRLQNILSGVSTRTAIMDGNTATSTVRFLKDSVLYGKNFGKNVVAAQNSEDVLNKLAQNPDAVGFVGLGWVGELTNPAQQKKLQNFDIGLVECVRCLDGTIARPSQSTISAGMYHLVRPLYYMFKDAPGGPVTRFVNFMSLERGQLIFRRAYLTPAKMNFKSRTTKVTETSN